MTWDIKSCLDDNIKTKIREFRINGKIIKIIVCEKCSNKSNFSGFISEIPINEVLEN